MNESLIKQVEKLFQLTAGKTKAPLIARIAATTWAKSNTPTLQLLIGLLLREPEANCNYWEPQDSDVFQVIEIASSILELTRNDLKKKGVYRKALLGLTLQNEVDPDWIAETARQIYGNMDKVLENKIGYNVKDAIVFSNRLIDLVIHLAERIRLNEKDGDSVQKLWRCFYFFPNVTAQRLGLNQKKFLSYIGSLMCEFGSDYGTPEQILCDCPLRTKPFIHVGNLDDDEIILCPLPTLLAICLLDQIDHNLSESYKEEPSILKRIEKEKTLFLER